MSNTKRAVELAKQKLQQWEEQEKGQTKTQTNQSNNHNATTTMSATITQETMPATTDTETMPATTDTETKCQRTITYIGSHWTSQLVSITGRIIWLLSITNWVTSGAVVALIRAFKE